MSLLEVEDLRTGYGHLPVLHGVSFSIEEGRTAVILGLNGAGKTTTLMSVAGIVKPWSGAIRFDGRAVGGREAEDLVEDGIVLVPEGRRVFPELSVSANLRLGAWVKRHDRDVVAHNLQRVFTYFPRLAERHEQAAGTLSGGEQQMLAVGRGLMSSPRLLLVDEASLGLAPKIALTLFETMRRINEDGTTVLMVEQNAGVLPLAHQAYILEKGVIVYSGTGEKLAASGEARKAYLGAPA
jgi:branched-chain amino acid transport system ATP-binding protein